LENIFVQTGSLWEEAHENLTMPHPSIGVSRVLDFGGLSWTSKAALRTRNMRKRKRIGNDLEMDVVDSGNGII
jgi:hypothetical protein